jgi:hypothetical protein
LRKREAKMIEKGKNEGIDIEIVESDFPKFIDLAHEESIKFKGSVIL